MLKDKNSYNKMIEGEIEKLNSIIRDNNLTCSCMFSTNSECRKCKLIDKIIKLQGSLL
jgi:hypothetical protein